MDNNNTFKKNVQVSANVEGNINLLRKLQCTFFLEEMNKYKIMVR